MAFSGVLPTEGVGSLGTKVCFEYVWKPGDSKGWDKGWDCSELSQPEIGHCFAILAPGCCPTLRSTCSSGWETLVWAGAAAGMQLLSTGSCPHTSTAATQADRWQCSCFCWWYAFWLDWHSSPHWRQAYVCVKHKVCLCFVAWSLAQNVRLNMHLANAVSILEFYATAVTHCQIICHCLWCLKVELNQSPD